MTAPNFPTVAAAATVVPVVTSAGVVNTAAITAANKVVVGILDPTMTQKIYNPVAEGNAVLSGDTTAKWMPVVGSVSGTTITDNLNGGVQSTGQVILNLTPAAANTVEASSVMSLKLSPQALVLLASNAATF